MSYRTSAPVGWRMKSSRYGFVGSVCSNCNVVFFPAKSFCIGCKTTTTKSHNLSGMGMIESFTIIRSGPTGFETQTPYCVAIVKLDEGPMISAQIVDDNENIEIGKRVRIVFRRLYENKGSIINYGFKFELDD